MRPVLAMEVEILSSMGWRVVSQTETTAALETRGPFSWWIFFFALLFFFLFGGLIYIVWWLIFDRHDLFLRVDNDQVVTSGDVWLVQRQRADLERTRQFWLEAKQKGFWSAAWPSIVAFAVGIVIWFILIWAFIQLVR
jgi:uncharacterized protein with PQ loop repeat